MIKAQLVKALIVYRGAKNNDLFELASNRDGLKDRWIALKDQFLALGYELVTEDLLCKESPAFVLYVDYPKTLFSKFIPSYLIQAETAQLYLENIRIPKAKSFRKIFTWNDDLVNNQTFVKITYSQHLKLEAMPTFDARPVFCCLIAANKALPKPDQHDLYLERQKAIAWFDRYAPGDLLLYGADWNLPARKPNLLSKLVNYGLKKLPINLNLRQFPAWQGLIKEKSDVLMKCKFNICFENVGNQTGYITEKIFDAFNSGCIPVYLGASNICDLVPKNCFIDMRDFPSYYALYQHLKNMNATTYTEYQLNIRSFFAHDNSNIFKASHFAETIVKHVLSDLNAQ